MVSAWWRQIFERWTIAERVPARRLRSASALPAEVLERRIVPALNVTFVAGALAITETGGINNDIEIYLSGGTLQIHDFNDTFSSAPGSSTLSNSNRRLNVPLTDIQSLSISTGSGNDIIDQYAEITGLSGNLSYNAERITIRDGASIDISGSISLTGTGSSGTGRGVYISRPAASGAFTIIRTIGSSSTITLTGTGGSTSGDTNAGVYIGTRPGSDSGRVLIEAVNGDISIVGTGGVWNTPLELADENLPGTLISAATIRTTGSGDISVSGFAPTSSNVLYGDRDGISIYDNTILETGSGGGISLTGSGRAGGEGIDTNDSDTVELSAGSGGITIAGSMADAGNGGGAVTLAGSITSTGGAISITGTGGSGGTVAVVVGPNSGSAPNVEIGSAQTTTVTITGTVAGGSEDSVLLTRVTAQSAGNFSVSGTARGTGEGVEITSSTITVNSGLLSITGTSPGDGGILLNDTDLLANNAAISITGTAGTTGGAALVIENGTRIGSASTTSVSLTGTARGGSGESDGISMTGGSITAVGAVTISGTAVGAGEGISFDGQTGGLTITAGTAFSATGTAVNDAGAIRFASVTINAGSPGITLSGTTTGTAPGIDITSSTLIAAAGPITLTGRSADDDGIQISGTNTIGNSTTTTISLTGEVTGGSGDNDGLTLTGITFRAAGAVQFSGTAKATGEGVEFSNTNLSTPGNITITAAAVDGAAAFFYDNSSLQSTAGSITATGTSTGTAVEIQLNGEASGAQQDQLIGALGVTLRGNTIDLHASDGTAEITGGGDLIIESRGSTFTSAVSTNAVDFGTGFNNIRLGKSTNTANINIGSDGASAAADIAIHGGTVTISGDLAAGDQLNLSASTLNSDAGTDISSASGISATVTTSGTLSGTLSGTGGLTKLGAGTLTLAAANSYSGATQLIAGTLLVNGSTEINSDVSVASGSTLGGNLTVNGEVTVSSGGKVAPGTSPGILSTGSISFSSGSGFDVEIGGTAVGTGYDQLNVTGTVSLGGATLNLIPFSGFSVSSASLQTYVIINNDGTDDVVGTFNGLPEGSPVTYGGGTLYISYAGSATGDAGNDVVLNSHPIINGTSVANSFVFRKSTTANRNEFSTNGGTSFIEIDNTPPVRFNGAAGIDTLIISYVNGNPAVAVDFHGGGQAGDLLTISDTIAAGRTGVYSVDATAPATAGALTVAGSALSFTGVSQVDATGIATVNLDSTTFPVADTTLTITSDTNSAGLAAVKISGSTGGTAFTPLFVRNTTTLAVNTSTPSGDDSVTISSLSGSSAGLTNLTVNTGTGIDSILAGAVNLPGNISLTSGGTLTVDGLGIISAGNVTLNADGDVFIQDDGVSNIAGSGSISVTSATGNIDLAGNGLASTTGLTITATTGSVTTPDSAADVTAPALTVTAGAGIELDTLINTLTAATVTSTGSIDITDGAGGLTVTLASTADGNISLHAAAGDLTLSSVSASGTSANVTGSTTTSGSILVASVVATTNVTLTAAAGGSINETSTDPAADITAATASLTGPAGIGNTSPIELNLTTLTLATTTESAAPISLSDTAGGLTVSSASTTDGSITLSAAAGDLTLTSITAGGSNQITLSTTTSGNVLVNSVTATGDQVTITSAGGIAESGSDSGAEITAASTSLTASTGIGSAAAIELAVSTLAVSNSTSGDVQLHNNSGGTLTISTVGSVTGLTNSGGDLTVSTSGALSISAAVSATGHISLAATDTPSSTDNLTLNGVSVISSGGDVTLSAGDNLTIPGSGSLRAAGDGTVTLNADTTDADSPDVPALLLILGTISFSGSNSGAVVVNAGDDNDTILFWDGTSGATINCGTGSLTVNAGAGEDTVVTGDATGAATLTAPTSADGVMLNGGDGFDSFSVQASLTTSFHINGGTPHDIILPEYLGDSLVMYLGAAEDVVFTLTGITSGFGLSSNAGALDLTSVELGVVVPGTGGPFDLVVDMDSSLELESNRLKSPNGDNPDTILILNTEMLGGTYLTVIYQADPASYDVLFRQPVGTMNSVTILGSEDDDIVLVAEDVTLGLPGLTADTTARNGHVNSTFTSLTTMTTAGIHLDGKAGSDAVGLALVTSHSVVFTPDLDTGSAAASGNVGIDAQLAISFEDVEGQFYMAAGGTLTVDATEMAAAGDLPLIALADYGITSDGSNVLAGTPSTNFPATIFGGFGNLRLSGGSAGNQLLMHSVDQSTPAGPAGAEPLNNLLVNGGSGNDQIVFLPTFSNWTGELEVHGGTGADQVIFQSALTLAANHDLRVDSESTLILAPLAVTGTGVLELHGTGTGTSPLDRTEVYAPLSSASGGVSITGNNLLLASGIFTSNSGAVTVNIVGSTVITSNGDISADGTVSITSAGGVISAGDINTTADTIDIHSPLALSGSVRLDSGTGADITLHSPVSGTSDGTGSLRLDAGIHGTIRVLDTIGGPATNTSRPATVEIIDSFGATFADTVRTSVSIVVSASRRDRDIIFNGAIVTPLLDAPEDPRRTDGSSYPPSFEFDDEYNLFIYGTGTHVGRATLSNRGELRLGDNPADTLIFEDGIFAVGQSAIYLQAIPRTYGAPVVLGDEDTYVYINSGTTVIDTTWGANAEGLPAPHINPTGADIVLGGHVIGLAGTGGENLTLTAGTDGDVVLLRNVGTAPGITARIGTLLITMANDVTVNNVLAEIFRQETGTGTTHLNGVINTNNSLATDIGNIVHGTPNPNLPTPLGPRSEPLGVDLLNVNIIVNDLITTRDTTAGGVRLRAIAGTNGVVTLNSNGIINSSQIVVLEGNATTSPAILVHAAATLRLGAPGEDVVVGTRRRFLITDNADAEFRSNVSMDAGPGHGYADIFFVDTGSGAGNITFTGTVDLNLSDLDVRSGLGNINFRGAVSEVHRLFLQEAGEGTLEGSAPTTVTFVANLTTEVLITAPGPYNVDLLGSVSTINVNQIQYYLPGNTTFLNTGRVTLGNQSTDRVSVIYGLSTTAASVTHIAGTVDAGYGMSLSPVLLTPANTIARLQGPSWWTISVAADASGNSVSQAGDNRLVLGTATSRQNYQFSGGVTAQQLITTQSTSEYDVAIHGPLTITGTTGTTFNNRGELRIGGSSGNVHQLSGGLTVNSNTAMTLSGQLTAAGNVLISPRLTVQSAGPARLAATGGSVSVGETVLADGVNLTLGSAATASITAGSITGAVGTAATSVAFQATGAVTVGGAIGGDLSDVVVVNAAAANFTKTVTSAGSLRILDGTGTVTFHSSVFAAGFTADAGTAAYNLQLLIGAAISGSVSLSNSGLVTLGDGPDAFSTPDTFRFGSFTRSGGPTQVFADFRTADGPLTAGDTITVTGASDLRSGSGVITLNNLVLNSLVTLDLGASGSGAINLATVGVASGATSTRLRLVSTGTTTVSGAVNGLTTLELSAGNAQFAGAVGTPTVRIGSIIRGTSAGTTTFSGNLYASEFGGMGGALNFVGPITDVTSAVLGTTSTVVLGDGGDVLNFAAGLTHTTGPTTINGTVTTTNSNIVLGAVTVVGSAALSTGLGAGDIDLAAVSGSGSLSTLSGQGHTIFRSTIGGLTNLTIQQAANVDFRNTVTLSGNLTQSTAPGTGTTTLRGGTIGGTVDVRAVAISLAAGTLTGTGTVSLTGSGSVALASGANLDAGSSTVRISAGGGGYTQSSGSSISSGSSDATAAIQVLVNGGNATLGGMTASHASGRIVVTITGAGSILDGNDTAAGTAINTTAGTMAFSAASGTIGTAANPLEYSRGTVSTPANAATTVFLRDASPNSGTVIGRYDFGRSTVVQDRFLGVSSATLFSAAAAYGRTGSYGFVTRPSEVSRSTTGLGKSSINLYSDSVVGMNAVTYRVRLPSTSTGPYQVRAYFGDRDIATNTVITGISGTSITSGSLASGLSSPKAFPMSVATVSDADADGVLTFQFARPAGFTGYWSVIGLDIATGTLPDAAPQLLAGLDFAAGGTLTEESQAQLAAVERRGQVLSEQLILEVREQVLAAWATTGLSAEALALLQSATVEIRDLNDRGMLGASGAAGTSEIWLDDDALGYGWSFTDEADGDVPAGTVDLATVMAHEYGHLLGWQDLDPQQYSGHLMAGELAVGERRGMQPLEIAPRAQETTVPATVPQVQSGNLPLFVPAASATSALALRDEEEAAVADPDGMQPVRFERRPNAATQLPDAGFRLDSPISTDQQPGHDLSLLDDVFADLVGLL